MASSARREYRARMVAARFVLFLTALAAACSPSFSEPQAPGVEPADLVVSGSCRHHEDTLLLAVAVTNRGRGPATPAAARVEFNGDPESRVVRRTRFIPAHAVDSFEVELPAVCSQVACRWNVIVDSPKQVHESGRC